MTTWVVIPRATHDAEVELAPWLQEKAAQGWTLVGLEQTPDSVSTKVSLAQGCG